MKGIVWGLNIDSAIKKLEEIEKLYEIHNVSVLVYKAKTKNKYEIRYINGDHWIACGASESARGRKCNISYIDARIDDEIINCIIKPCTSIQPYQAFHYYWDFV